MDGIETSSAGYHVSETNRHTVEAAFPGAAGLRHKSKRGDDVCYRTLMEVAMYRSNQSLTQGLYRRYNNIDANNIVLSP
ncbi:hypothetical protein J6590_030844 [Homalodisca vitripennis]|nr:hypothetical protein J6590_030844 [Homalodisca vitripennis]